ISVSRAESCLRMPNISSCLRIVLAFSTSSSSANETSSAGVLDLRSWSFISRMRVESYWDDRRRSSKCNGWSARGGGRIADLRRGLGPSGPMQRQVPITRTGTRLHLPAFGEIAPTYENNVRCARVSPWRTSLFSDRSERLDHHQDHDRDHENRRHLIDNTIEFLAILIPVSGEIRNPPHIQPVHCGKAQHQEKFRLQPVRRVPTAAPNEAKTQDPRGDHGRIDDGLEQPPLHHLEGFRLLGARLGLAVIDE